MARTPDPYGVQLMLFCVPSGIVTSQ
jgi:hypothetical protein